MIKLIEKINGTIRISDTALVDFEKKYDIVVAGLGTAGVISAITAARMGKSILGVERFAAPGGTITVGGVGVYYFGGRGGVYEDVDCAQKNSAVNLVEAKYPNSDHRKYILDKFLEGENISLMYESVITGIYVNGREIVGIRVFDGINHNIGLKALIDATGEGDICDMAGCSMSFGRDGDNSPIPYTIVKSYITNGILTKTNHDSSKVDQRDTEAFSESIIKSYAAFCDGNTDEFIIKLQPLPGMREGRLLNGEEKIVFDDILAGKLSEEPVIYAYSDFDKHGLDIAFDSELFVKWHVLANLGALNVTVPIPKEVLIAKEYDNLAVSGRCLSVDHEVATLARMMRDMQKLGEASAVIASVAIDDGVTMKDVSYPKLKEILEETGCLNIENNKGFRYDHRISAPDYIKDAMWLTDAETINKELSTLSPGLAIWSARLMGDKAVDFLVKNLDSENENLRKHSAIALALLNRPDGAAVLREMVSERDRTLLTDMRKNNKFHIVQALCALGIIKDKESIGVISQLVADREEYTYYPTNKGVNSFYYYTLSSAVSALLKICKTYPDCADEILALLDEELSDYKYIKEITSTDKNSSEYIQA